MSARSTNRSGIFLVGTHSHGHIHHCLPAGPTPFSLSLCLSVPFSHLMWAAAKRMKRCAVCQQQISVLAMPRFISLAFSLLSSRPRSSLFLSLFPSPPPHLSAVHFSSFLVPPLRLSSLHSGHYNSIMAVKQFYFGLFCCAPSLPLLPSPSIFLLPSRSSFSFHFHICAAIFIFISHFYALSASLPPFPPHPVRSPLLYPLHLHRKKIIVCLLKEFRFAKILAQLFIASQKKKEKKNCYWQKTIANRYKK